MKEYKGMQLETAFSLPKEIKELIREGTLRKKEVIMSKKYLQTLLTFHQWEPNYDILLPIYRHKEKAMHREAKDKVNSINSKITELQRIMKKIEEKFSSGAFNCKGCGIRFSGIEKPYT